MAQKQFSALLIERDRLQRLTLCQILSLRDYTVDAVANGQEALVRLQHASYQFVLIDIELADYDGLKLIQTIQHVAPQLPIVVLTACSNMDTAVRARQLKTAVYLIKPIDPNLLLLHIKHALCPNHNYTYFTTP